MTTLISIVIIIVAVYFISSINSNKSTRIKNNSRSSEESTYLKAEEDLLYKKIGIKTFIMKGMFYQKLNTKSDNGNFIGFAKCDNNSHDMYAVGIYNDSNKLLGYTPKGNKRLNFSLSKWHSGRVIVWGHLRYEDYNDKWYGEVFIPVGYTESQLKQIERFLTLKLEIENQINLKPKETEKYFEILNKHREIVELLENLKNPEDLLYKFPKNILPSISKQLEIEKNWEKLSELEKHQDLIDGLSNKFKEATLNRITLAKSKVVNN